MPVAHGARLPAFARLAIVASLLFYAAAEAFYVLRLPLIMDEFQGAAAVQRLLEGVPYRDFTPYKTVVGYYLQLPALAFVRGPWSGLMAVKLEMLVLNLAGLWLLVVVLRRYFSATALALSFPMLVVTTTFLERSAELRVDMLTGWVGAASLLGLMAGLPFAAGLLGSLSFLISQKGIYFCGAGAIALMAAVLHAPSSVPRFRSLRRYALGLGSGVAAYVGAWTILASPAVVWEATFARPAGVAMEELPMARALFWLQTGILNPVFWVAVLVGLTLLLLRPSTVPLERTSASLLGSYAAVTFMAAVWHKQPWPYFIAMLVPVLFLPAVAAVDATVAALRGSGGRTRGIAVAVWLIGGLIVPLSGMGTTLTRNNAVQRRTVRLAHGLLRPDEPYLAGLLILRDRPQRPSSMSWLDTTRRRALFAATQGQQLAYADSIKRNPAKIVIDNYRMRSLPCPLLEALDAQYQWLGGNVWLYAPLVRPTDSGLIIAYSGEYQVSAEGAAHITIDSQTLRDGNRVRLLAGAHRVRSSSHGRLRLLPPAGALGRDSAPPMALFQRPYEYVLPVDPASVTGPTTFSKGCAQPADGPGLP